MNAADTTWVKHLLIRIFALPLVFILIYMMVLGGKTDPMGLGLIYAFLALAAVGFIFLGIEAVVLYRKKRMNKFYCNVTVLFVVFYLVISLLGGS